MSAVLQIRPATPAEVDLAVDWAAAEGWNPGRVDALCYRIADPQAFLIGLLDGEPVATISVVRYDDSFGFLGFYIVKPEFRGQGLGMQIWNAGLRYLDGCCVGLDGVVEQISNYQKSGFELAFRNLRFAGTSGGEAASDASIVDLSKLPLSTLLAYERPFFPAARDEFVQQWISQPEAGALGKFHDGQLLGYGVIRPCRSGAKIGPLYADSPEIAESLMRALKAKIGPNSEIFLDVPDNNPAALALAQTHGMDVVFECARMYKGVRPELPTTRMFGVTSLEIG